MYIAILDTSVIQNSIIFLMTQLLSFAMLHKSIHIIQLFLFRFIILVK